MKTFHCLSMAIAIAALCASLLGVKASRNHGKDSAMNSLNAMHSTSMHAKEGARLVQKLKESLQSRNAAEMKTEVEATIQELVEHYAGDYAAEEPEEEVKNEFEYPRDQLPNPSFEDPMPDEEYLDPLRHWYNTEGIPMPFTSPTQREEDFQKTYAEDDKVTINTTYFLNPNSDAEGCVLLSPGQSEAGSKYDENAYDVLYKGKYKHVYVISHRGQGASSRLLWNNDDDDLKAYVEEGKDFVADFREFVNTAHKRHENDCSENFNIICHSMGCAIAFQYVMEEHKVHRHEPNKINALAAYAPLIKPITDPFPYAVAVVIGYSMDLIGIGTDYAPTKESTFDDSIHERHFSTSSTRSYTRWLRAKENCQYHKDKEYNSHKGVCQAGVTGHFALEFFKMFESFESFYDDVAYLPEEGESDDLENNGRISLPILIHQAGEDKTVINGEQDIFCDKACEACELYSMEDVAGGSKNPKCQHNIWQERDHYRTASMNHIFQFLKSHRGKPREKGELWTPPGLLERVSDWFSSWW